MGQRGLALIRQRHAQCKQCPPQSLTIVESAKDRDTLLLAAARHPEIALEAGKAALCEQPDRPSSAWRGHLVPRQQRFRLRPPLTPVTFEIPATITAAHHPRLLRPPPPIPPDPAAP